MKKMLSDIIYELTRIYLGILLISAVIIGMYEMPNILAWGGLTDGYTRVMGNFYVNSAYSVDEAAKLNDFVKTLPPVFIKEFKSNWRVIIEDHILIPTAGNVVVGGYTDWQSRIIVVKKQATYDDTLDIFVHELGHCFDFEYGSVSFSDEFSDTYNLYKENFEEESSLSPDGYSTSSAVEFFATCFKEYLLCPGHLNNVAPEAYEFVDDFYEDITEIKYIYVYDFGAIANTVRRFASA